MAREFWAELIPPQIKHFWRLHQWPLELGGFPVWILEDSRTRMKLFSIVSSMFRQNKSQEAHVEHRSITWLLRGRVSSLVGNHGNSPAGSQSAYGCCCLTASGANKRRGNKKDDKEQGVMVMGKTCRLEKEQETNLRTKQSFVLQQHAKQSAGCMGFNTSVSDS